MTTLNQKLSNQQVQSYKDMGYLVVPDLLTSTEINTFLQNEEKPNKKRLGLRTHVVDPQWAYLAHHPKVSAYAAQLLETKPMIVQTMYLPKAPLGELDSATPGVALHQDTLYIPNEPNTLMACWLALDDTSSENGGLCIVANSHQSGLKKAHHNQNTDEHVSWVQTYDMSSPDGKKWSEELCSFEMDDLEQMDIKHLSVPAGGGVFFTGLTIHGSYANLSPSKYRRAFAIHYVGQGTWVYRSDIQELVEVNLQITEDENHQTS